VIDHHRQRAVGTHPAVPSDVLTRTAQGIAVVRVLLGLTFFLNGLAKLFAFHRVHLGWYVANLIDRADARFILNAEVNHNARYHVWLVSRIANHLVLPHWGFFQWALTAVELGAGVLLVLGLWSRLGAAVALVPTVFLFFMYLSNDRWAPEQPLELVPLAVLAFVPAGRVWGLDQRRARVDRLG
jgi:uncharacterized membrane protein YphA (DoxX/SURF4 family)